MANTENALLFAVVYGVYVKVFVVTSRTVMQYTFTHSTHACIMLCTPFSKTITSFINFSQAVVIRTFVCTCAQLTRKR